MFSKIIGINNNSCYYFSALVFYYSYSFLLRFRVIILALNETTIATIIEITTVSKNIFVNPSIRRVDVKIITNSRRMYIINDSALFRSCKHM